MSAANIEITQALFAAFGAGDVPGILAHVNDDIRIEFYGPSDIIPYADFYEGMDEARRFFETVLASVDIHVFDTQEFLSDGDKVVVTGVLHLTAKSTGRDIKSDFVHVITMKDGKWSKFRDFMDTHEAVKAFGK